MIDYEKIQDSYVKNYNLTSFKEYCNCGGHAKQPVQHMNYCRQYNEVMEWYKNGGGYDD